MPQLRFEIDDRRFLVAALATDGSDSGDSGPFTFVEVTLPFGSGGRMRLQRRTNSLGGWFSAAILKNEVATGDAEFDESFRITSDDQVDLHDLLALQDRKKLMQSTLPRLEIRLEGQKITVYRDGIPQEKAELDEMIAIASRLADRCAGVP